MGPSKSPLGVFYVASAAAWVLLRHLGVLPQTPLLLLGAVLVSWALLVAVYIGVKTLIRRHRSKFNDLPGPKRNNWLYDHVFDIFDEPLAWNVTKWINERPYPDGLMHFFGLYGSEYIVPTDHEGLQDVLSNHSYDYQKSSAFRKYAIRFFGDGLVSQEQEVHKKSRKSFMPIFNQTAIHKVNPMITAKSMQFVDRVSDRCNESTGENSDEEETSRTAVIRITELIFKVSMDIASNVGIGYDIDTLGGKNLYVYDSLHTIFSSNHGKRVRFILHNLLPRWLNFFIPSEDESKMDQARAQMVQTIRTAALKREEQVKAGDANQSDFLTNLVKSGAYNEEEHLAHLSTVLAAGYESTGGSLSFVVYCLAAHQQAQQALRDELNATKQGRPHIDEEEYDKLPVLNALVMESLRHFPAFALLLHKSIRDTTIKGRYIPKGTYIGICPRAINFAEHLWGPDAGDFNIERWIDRSNPAAPKTIALGGSPATACFMSFGYGTRSCVGRHLAMAHMKRQVALITERFQVETLDDKYPHPSGLFASTPPLDLNLRFNPSS